MEKPDKITNWYTRLDNKNNDAPTIDKNFKTHMILPCSRIGMIGGSGAGKTNALLEFLHRKKDSFYEIVIFTSNPDEPLLKQLKSQIPEVKIVSDIKDVPAPNETEIKQAKYEKLFVADDFVTLPKKDLKKIEQYAIAGRKFGWTSIFMAQNYTSIPKLILRQIEYFVLYRLNDLGSIKNIVRNHNVDALPKDDFIRLYTFATEQPRDFFMLDLKGDGSHRYRRNFLDVLSVE